MKELLLFNPLPSLAPKTWIARQKLPFEENGRKGDAARCKITMWMPQHCGHTDA